MSLYKTIEHGKEHRRPYRDSRAVDYTCRNHGACDWCRGNRQFNERREIERMSYKLNEAVWTDKETYREQ